MSLNWIELLDGADGKSEDVISIFVDIRGFTEFCKLEDDKNIATYITKIYQKIIKDYFPNLTFYKPMGDGLLLVQKYEEKNAIETVLTLIDSCLKLIDEFHNLIDKDIMIIFETPNKIGVGMIRGTACCIYNGDKIIDYSGKRLNHAARLMEKARPSGLVMDYASIIGILPPELLDLFVEDSVCIRGVAEKTPIKILYQKNSVTIRDTDREPINEPKWVIQRESYKVSVIKTFGKSYQFHLDNKPTNKDSIILTINFPNYIKGKETPDTVNILNYGINDSRLSCKEEGPDTKLTLKLNQLVKGLKDNETPDGDGVDVIIQYY